MLSIWHRVGGFLLYFKKVCNFYKELEEVSNLDPFLNSISFSYLATAPSPSSHFGPADEVKERLHLLARK